MREYTKSTFLRISPHKSFFYNVGNNKGFLLIEAMIALAILLVTLLILGRTQGHVHSMSAEQHVCLKSVNRLREAQGKITFCSYNQEGSGPIVEKTTCKEQIPQIRHNGHLQEMDLPHAQFVRLALPENSMKKYWLVALDQETLHEKS